MTIKPGLCRARNEACIISLVSKMLNFKHLAYCVTTAWFVFDLVGNPEGRYSQYKAHLMNAEMSLAHSLDLNKLLDKVCHISCSIVESPATDNYKPSVKEYEPSYEKTGFLHMRKQRRRSASR